jgi:hypothetical protein
MKLYAFMPVKEKTLTDFINWPCQNGLSPSVHKGYLCILKGQHYYEMHFICSSKTKTFQKAIMTKQYPLKFIVTGFVEKLGRRDRITIPQDHTKTLKVFNDWHSDLAIIAEYQKLHPISNLKIESV